MATSGSPLTRQLPAAAPAAHTSSAHAPSATAQPSRSPGLTRDLAALCRPGQWTKNLVVVPLALIDARQLTGSVLGGAARAVVAFTLASAFTYLVNDISDRDRDRRHPQKRHRPIAAGRVGVGTAVAFAGALLVLLALTVTVPFGRSAGASLGAVPIADWWPIPAYLALNIAYSRGLKHIPLLDVFIVATGFVLRLVQGYLATGAEVSSWLALCLFSLCLMLILGKRRHEMTVGGVLHRPALRGYTIGLLDQLLAFAAVLAAISYVLFVRTDALFGSDASIASVLSAPFALFGLARYLQLLTVDGGGGNPARALFRDRATIVNALLWTLVAGVTVLIAHTAS